MNLEKNIHSPELAEFLNACRPSSEQAINALQSLMDLLENSTSNDRGIRLLTELKQFTKSRSADEMRSEFHFHFLDMEIPGNLNETIRLQLLQLPSTFAPEEWSFTFFEGLSRYTFSEFHDKQMVELGCGNGWITISMALKYNCRKIFGLDINPRAILSSKINLYLNAYDDQNALIRFSDGRSLLEAVEFKVSDLLSCFYTDRQSDFDVIIGCIPQVLAPDEGIDQSMISDSTNDDFLHSLSNYTAEQGYVEDKFGLGLIARSVEESIEMLKPQGKLILNLGERPRREVLERLVKRRGLLINRIWTRKVEQANDTDIDSLVRLEKEMNHHFEFYTDLHSETPINARTAKLFASRGGRIYHNLSVYECKFDFYTETQVLFDELKNELFSEAKTGLDLDYTDSTKKEEKIRFLSELIKDLRKTPFFPYEDNQGSHAFRNYLSDFLSAYQHVHFSEEHVLVAPNLATLIENVRTIYAPKSLFLSEPLFKLFPDSGSHEEVISVPTCSKELNSLIEQIRPQIVFASISNNQNFSGEAFLRIVESCKRSNSRLFLDLSECFELSSSPQSIGVFQYLAENPLPLHVTLVGELSKNQIYSDLKTCFAISTNTSVLSYLRNAAEYSYSRSPYLAQLFYSILLKDLTGFHMKSSKNTASNQPLEKENDQMRSIFITPTASVNAAFQHSSIKGNDYSIDEQTIRFDYGENELNCPDDLKISILESFTRQSMELEEYDPKQVIKHFVSQRFGLRHGDQMYYGNGVAPLFAALAKKINAEDGTILIPQGAYGYFYGTAQFHNVKIQIIPTDEENAFLPTATSLKEALRGIRNPWLFLNFPLVNPTGACWTNDLLRSLLEIDEIQDTKIIIDTVFSGLEFNGPGSFPILTEKEDDLNYVLLGGISKEYSAGGIRFGYALSNFCSDLSPAINYVPHKTVLHAVKKIYSKYLDADQRVLHALEAQTGILQERAVKLTTLLRQHGWTVVSPQGGLFLVAKPTTLIGKTCKLRSGEEIEIDATSIGKILHDKVNLLINNDQWTGIPGFCRFVLSVEESTFKEGIKRIEQFHTELNNL